MSDMTIKEIEELIERLDSRTLEEVTQDPSVWSKLRYKTIPDPDCERAASALRQLMNEQKWRDISEFPDDLKDGRPVLIGGGLQRDLPWTEPAFWHDGSQCHPGRGSAGFFAESDRGNLLTARNVTGEVFMPLPLPSPPETSDA